METKYEPTQAELKQVNIAFQYHPPQGDQQQRYVGLREGGRELAMLILKQCPPGREKSLALTNLEQTIMWANSAIARNEGT